ncbi:MAG: hypothetical protein GY874_07760 [Desulfobacteraceae bacterium]|nr:hypothetical protein [Desulfobacteraceae bacterium]
MEDANAPLMLVLEFVFVMLRQCGQTMSMHPLTRLENEFKSGAITVHWHNTQDGEKKDMQDGILFNTNRLNAMLIIVPE